MDTNGTGEEPRDWLDLPAGAFPAIAELIDQLVAERPALADHKDALYRLAGISARLGEEALRARFVSVRFDADVIGVSELEGREAADFLATLGIDGQGQP